MHMLEGMGIETGVDLDKLIDCVWMMEKMIGRYAWGHVSRTGPRPMTPDKFFDANAPFVETVEQAKHFKLGKQALRGLHLSVGQADQQPVSRSRAAGCSRPTKSDGTWPWEEEFFPKPQHWRSRGVGRCRSPRGEQTLQRQVEPGR